MNTIAAKIVPHCEQRQVPRRSVKQDAVTLAAGRSDGISCVVVDISESGARIIVENGKKLTAERMKLYIEESHQIIDCEQVWRNGNEVGLKILSTAKMAQ